MEFDFSGLRILIIDDERVMRQLLTRFLAQLEIYDVITASDGFEALNKFSTTKENFDLVICDIGMPNMNGLDFVKRLRASTDLLDYDVPVLMVTGHSDSEIVQDAVKAGIQGFLVKPITKKALASRIAAALKLPTILPG